MILNKVAMAEDGLLDIPLYKIYGDQSRGPSSCIAAGSTAAEAGGRWAAKLAVGDIVGGGSIGSRSEDAIHTRMYGKECRIV